MGQGTRVLPAGRREGHGAVSDHEAVGCFEQALSALPHLPEDARHARAGHRSPARPAHMHSFRLGLGAYPRPICARPRPSPRPWTTRVGWAGSLSICPSFYLMGAYDRAIAAAQRALALAAAARGVGPARRAAQTAPRPSLSNPGRLSPGDRLPPADSGVLRRSVAPGSASVGLSCPL